MKIFLSSLLFVASFSSLANSKYEILLNEFHESETLSFRSFHSLRFGHCASPENPNRITRMLAYGYQDNSSPRFSFYRLVMGLTTDTSESFKQMSGDVFIATIMQMEEVANNELEPATEKPLVTKYKYRSNVEIEMRRNLQNGYYYGVVRRLREGLEPIYEWVCYFFLSQS